MAKTAKGLVEYAKAQLGKPYWYGTFGQAASKELYDQKKDQYPNYYTTPYNGTTAKVHDCVGLIKGYLWCDSANDTTPVYDLAQDKSANAMRTACKTKGEMATMPEVPGLLVFYNGHVGVYIGGGEVIEARGRKYGVVKTKLAARPWTSWGYCPFITYEQEQVITVALPVLRKGTKSETVQRMQDLLIGHGYDMEGYGADGSFGGATKRTVEKFQKEKRLPVTGECDAATWAKLLGV
jgi:hypothetical protein